MNMIMPSTSDVALTMTIQGTFKKKEISESFTEDISKIARSSHSIAVVNDKLYLFGGEHQPRIPVDAQMYIYDLKNNTWKIVPETETTPRARVGATMSAVGDDIYVFGGRGGKEMAPLPSHIYKFSTIQLSWSQVDVSAGTTPEARSFHAMAASETDLYVFGGCPVKGRLNDLHRFNIESRTWSELTKAPVSPRGGAALVYHNQHLYLHGGFDGNEHSELVVYNISKDTWQTPRFTDDVNDRNTVPAPRSVHCMVPFQSSSDSSQVNLAILFGEGHPSDLGHDGAGSFFDDGWCVSIGGGQEHETLQASWTRLNFAGDIPVPRGWFQAVPISGDKILLSGGLNDDNARLADLYVLQMET